MTEKNMKTTHLTAALCADALLDECFMDTGLVLGPESSVVGLLLGWAR